MEPFLLYALLGGLFTWGLTAVGAASVFFAREPSRKLLDAMLGFAAGVMLAASVFSLLVPGMEMAEAMPMSIVEGALGFFLRMSKRLKIVTPRYIMEEALARGEQRPTISINGDGIKH